MTAALGECTDRIFLLVMCDTSVNDNFPKNCQEHNRIRFWYECVSWCDLRLVSYSNLKQKVSGNSLILSRPWLVTRQPSFPQESLAIWGQGQAVHFATIGLSQGSYFTNRYESQFQQKVEIRHQIPSFWDITSNLGPKRFICVYFSYRNAQTWMFECKYFSDSQDMISVVNLKLQGLGLIPDPRLKTGPFLNP